MNEAQLSNLLDDPDDFEFGELPDDSNSAGDEHDIDANNEETFGENIPPGPSDELEDYAAQTACLRLDDWESPGCSDAPDASQLPLPDFSNGMPKFDEFFRSYTLGSFDPIWGQNSGKTGWDVGTVTSSIFAASEPRLSEQVQLPSGGPSIPSMPKAPTVDEIEQAARCLPLNLTTATLQSQQAECSFDDVSKQLALSKGSPQEIPPNNLPSRNGYPSFRPPNMRLPPAPMLPPMPPVLLQFVPIWMDFLTRRIQYLPHSVPPVHPFVIFLMKHNDPRTVMSIIQQQYSNIPVPAVPSHTQPPVSHGHNASYNTHYHKKTPGMPSGKTIEDLAFDQFAGFMSCKERQWLVRIQLMQCQGATNNPYNDDFYYECWRRKRLSHGIQLNSAKRSGDKSDNQSAKNGSFRRTNRDVERNVSSSESREKDFANRFAGALGLPSKCTTSNPRQSIKVETADTVEEEHRNANTQKRLRTLLLRIESATNFIIESQDLVVALQSGVSGITREAVQQEISSRIQAIISDLCGEDLSKVIQIGKGRRVIEQLFRFGNPSHHAAVFNKFFSLPVAQKKPMWPEFPSALLNILSSLSRDQLISLTNGLDTSAIISSIQSSQLSRDILFVLLFLCCTKKASANNALFHWLRSPVARQSCSNTWAANFRTTCQSLDIPRADVLVLAEWLQLLVDNSKQVTVASEIASVF